MGTDIEEEERGGLAARLSYLSAFAFVHGPPSAHSCRVPLLVMRSVAWVEYGRNTEERGGRAQNHRFKFPPDGVMLASPF